MFDLMEVESAFFLLFAYMPQPPSFTDIQDNDQAYIKANEAEGKKSQIQEISSS